MKKLDWRPILILLVFVILCISAIPKVQDASDNPEQEVLYGDGWSITGIRAERGETFHKCDATDDMVYFSYTKGWYIDAYNNQGEYQYTIMLRTSQNGSVGIHCTEDLLYVRSKDGTVFVFDGTDMVETLTSEQAGERGCYFLDMDGRAYVSEDYIYRVNSDGEWTGVCPIPEDVAANMSFFAYGDRQTKNILRFALTILPLIIVFIFMLPKRGKKEKQTL